jgi:HEAT repeat protein
MNYRTPRTVSILRALVTLAVLASTMSCASLAELGRVAVAAGGDQLRKRGMESAADRTENLQGQLDSAMETERQLEELQAIGEVGDEAAFELAQPCLRHRDARLRRAAVEALRSDESAEALAALIDRLEIDADADVRATAARLLTARDDDRARQSVLEAVQDDDASEVRRAIVNELVKRRELTEETRALLQRVHERDPDPEIRELAGGAL